MKSNIVKQFHAYGWDWYLVEDGRQSWISEPVKKRIEELEAENAKLVDVLHEVETEAVYAYHCLQQDCVTTANSSEHFFKKWWHTECECDRLKSENAKLRELARDAWGNGHPDKSCGDCEIIDECHAEIEEAYKKGNGRWNTRCLFERRIEDRMRELGVDA